MPEGKIKSKDLSYEATLPPFLQKLHAQKAGWGDQDRHERPLARPKRAKAHDEDDEPTVVDEAGETVSKAELDKMTTAQEGNGEDENVKTVGEESEQPKGSGAIQDQVQRTDQQVTDGTATKKRKVAKVVGEGEEEGNATTKTHSDNESAAKKVAKKAKKKAKPIKLAFDEDEET
jgi:hypothetical protein